MIKEIKNTKNVLGYVFRHDVENAIIHYEEQVKGEAKYPKACYVVPTKILIAFDKNLSRKDLKEFIEYLQSIKLPTNDMRYM